MAAELDAWLIALTVGLGILLAVLAEIYLRQQEFTIKDLEAEIEALRSRIEWLSRDR